MRQWSFICYRLKCIYMSKMQNTTLNIDTYYTNNFFLVIIITQNFGGWFNLAPIKVLVVYRTRRGREFYLFFSQCLINVKNAKKISRISKIYNI